MKIKGIAHVHSRFSDGFLSLARIKKRALNLGVNLILVSDHLAKIKDFDKLKSTCQKLSDNGFLMIPGVEVMSKERYHLLVYNLNNIPFSIKPRKSPLKELVNALSSEPTMLILAHPNLYRRLPPPEILSKLDGIEVWNTKYNSRYAPDLKWRRLALENNLIPFIGVDAHGPYSLKKIWFDLDVPALKVKDVIFSLKNSPFKSSNKSFSIDLTRSLSQAETSAFRFVNKLYSPVRVFIIFWVRRNIRVPEFLVKNTRKFL